MWRFQELTADLCACVCGRSSDWCLVVLSLHTYTYMYMQILNIRLSQQLKGKGASWQYKKHSIRLLGWAFGHTVNTILWSAEPSKTQKVPYYAQLSLLKHNKDVKLLRPCHRNHYSTLPSIWRCLRNHCSAMPFVLAKSLYNYFGSSSVFLMLIHTYLRRTTGFLGLGLVSRGVLTAITLKEHIVLPSLRLSLAW